MDVNDKTLKALATAIKFREMRQQLLSSNVANSKTPGYKAKRLDFEDALARALNVDGKLSMDSDHHKHYDVGNGGFNNLQPEVYDDPNGIVTADGNTVDVEDELARMSENKIMYDALVQLINKKMSMKKYVLTSER